VTFALTKDAPGHIIAAHMNVSGSVSVKEKLQRRQNCAYSVFPHTLKFLNVMEKQYQPLIRKGIMLITFRSLTVM